MCEEQSVGKLNDCTNQSVSSHSFTYTDVLVAARRNISTVSYHDTIRDVRHDRYVSHEQGAQLVPELQQISILSEMFLRIKGRHKLSGYTMYALSLYTLH